MRQRKKKGEGRNPDALRHRSPIQFHASEDVEEKLERLARDRTGGSKAALLRLLITEAPEPSGGQSSGQSKLLVRGGVADLAQRRRTASKAARGMKLAVGFI